MLHRLLILLCVTFIDPVLALENEWARGGPNKALYELYTEKRIALRGTSMKLTSHRARPEDSAGAYYYTPIHDRRGQRVLVQAMVRRAERFGDNHFHVHTERYDGRWPDRVRSIAWATLDRPALNEWHPIEVVIEIPEDAYFIFVYVSQEGPGTTYIDDVRIKAAPDDAVATGPMHLKVPLALDAGPGPDDPWPSGWYAETPGNSAVTPVLDESDGTLQLRGSAGSARPTRYLQSVRARDFQGEPVRLSGRLKGEGLAGEARMVVEFSESQFCSGDQCDPNWISVSEPIPDDGTWRQPTLETIVPETAEFMRVGVQVDGEGTLWVDRLEARVGR